MLLKIPFFPGNPNGHLTESRAQCAGQRCNASSARNGLGRSDSIHEAPNTLGHARRGCPYTGHHLLKPVLENHFGPEILDSKRGHRDLIERFLRDQPHNFTSHDTGAMALGLGSNGFENHFNGSLLVIGQIHRNLRLISFLQEKPHGFHVRESAA